MSGWLLTWRGGEGIILMAKPRTKGMGLEYEWRDKLIDSGLDKYARRSIMSGAVFEPGDIKTSLPFTFECKCYQKIGIYKWWGQAVRESTASKRPVLVMKEQRVGTNKYNTQPVLVAMNADEWTEVMTYAIKGGYLENR